MNRYQPQELYKEFPSNWQCERRTEFLKARIAAFVMKAWEGMELHEDYVRRNRLIEMILTQEHLEKILQEIIKAQGEIISLRQPERERKDRITPEMIENARAFPFSELVGFTRNAARCPFHGDKSPSFILLKDNRARCFGACSKTWDTIGFLMEKEGLTFPQAVRRLQ